MVFSHLVWSSTFLSVLYTIFSWPRINIGLFLNAVGERLPRGSAVVSQAFGHCGLVQPGVDGLLGLATALACLQGTNLVDQWCELADQWFFLS